MELLFPPTSLGLPQRSGERLWYHTGRWLAAALFGVFFDLDVVVQNPIPKGAKVIASNHPTTIDPVIMTTLVPEQVSILISETLFKVPVLGSSLRWSGHIRVVHADGKGAFGAGLDYLRAGRTVGIFPEGALSPHDGSPARLHTGAVRLSMLSGTPIIPVGAAPEREKILRVRTIVDGKVETGAWYLRGGYAVTVGDAFWPLGDPNDRALVRRETDELGRRIARLAAESEGRLLAKAVRSKPYGVPFIRRARRNDVHLC